MSSLSRAFTTRRAKMSIDTADGSKGHRPQRSHSTREKLNPVLRHKISGPVNLVSTTNMLSYNAPDLPRPSRSNSSLKSDNSTAPSTTETTPPTSPDVGLDESNGLVPNHLSTYFMAPSKSYTAPAVVDPPPAIPQRSPSHTKKNSYDALARQRSISRMSKDSDHSVSTKNSYTFSRSSSTSTRASSVSHTSTPQKPVAPPMAAPAPPASYQSHNLKESHPFGQELAQVTELAEEYQAMTKIDQEDMDYLESRGLVRHAAEDYLSDVQNLLTSFFNDTAHSRPSVPMWI